MSSANNSPFLLPLPGPDTAPCSVSQELWSAKAEQSGSAMTNASSKLIGRSHFCFRDFCLSKGLGCVRGVCLVLVFVFYWFSCPRKFQLLCSGFHFKAPSGHCTALVFFPLNLPPCPMPLPRCHRLQALSSFCCFSVPCSGDCFTHVTCYAGPLVAFHRLFRVPLTTLKLKILKD